MRICLITNEKLGESIRLEKQARTLLKLGHELVLICWGDKFICHQKFCGVIPVYGIVRRIPWLLSKLITQFYKLFFIDVLALRFIFPVINRFRPHVVLVRDFDLVRTVLIARRFRYFKMIYDVNDLVSYRMQSIDKAERYNWLYRLYSRLNEPFVGIKRVRRLELRYFQETDIITTPTDHYKEKMISNGIFAGKITMLPNYEDLSWRQSVIRKPEILKKFKDQFVVIYVGSFSSYRGIDILIRAMSIIREKIKNSKLILVGPVRDVEEKTKKSFEDMVEKMNLSDVVYFTGKVSTELVLSYIDAANVCVSPFKDTIHTNEIAGHKIFMYMASGKPLVVTDLRLQSRIINHAGCGLTVPPNSPEQLAKAIEKLYQDVKLRQELGARGQVFVKQRYNWEIGAKDFVSIIDKLEEETAQ